MRVVPTRFDSDVVTGMVAEIQRLYVELYGGPDETPVRAEEFAHPHGHFVVAYVDGAPAAMGGWRLRVPGAPGHARSPLPGSRPAEIKRMFVRPHLRGRGLARVVLGEIETSARRAGVDWLVLETGIRQPAAIGLYRSAGYDDVAPFGMYADEEGSSYLGKRL